MDVLDLEATCIDMLSLVYGSWYRECRIRLINLYLQHFPLTIFRNGTYMYIVLWKGYGKLETMTSPSCFYIA